MSGDRIRLEVKVRDELQLGTRRVKRLRREGLVPGVLYGKGAARAIAVDERALREAFSGPSGLRGIFDVVLEGQTTEHHAVLKQFQRHPIRGTVTHIDFHEVRLDRPIQASLSVQLAGESRGVKAGGVLQQGARELLVEGLPAAIPESIEFDVSEIDIGGMLRLADVPVPELLTFVDDPDTVIASVVAPRGVTAEEAEEAEAAAAEAAAAAAEAADETAPEE